MFYMFHNKATHCNLKRFVSTNLQNTNNKHKHSWGLLT